MDGIGFMVQALTGSGTVPRQSRYRSWPELKIGGILRVTKAELPSAECAMYRRGYRLRKKTYKTSRGEKRVMLTRIG